MCGATTRSGGQASTMAAAFFGTTAGKSVTAPRTFCQVADRPACNRRHYGDINGFHDWAVLLLRSSVKATMTSDDGRSTPRDSAHSGTLPAACMQRLQCVVHVLSLVRLLQILSTTVRNWSAEPRYLPSGASASRHSNSQPSRPQTLVRDRTSIPGDVTIARAVPSVTKRMRLAVQARIHRGRRNYD